ncbi:MAG TPA: TolC family protein [Balneolaceae bacterium]
MNKFFTFAIAVTLIFISATDSFAQENMGSLSLGEAIEIAHEQSAIADAARYALLSSKYQYESFQADLLPRLVLSGNAPNYRKNIFTNTLDNGTIVFSSQRQSTADAFLSVEQNVLLTGGTLSLSTGLTRLGIFFGEDNYFWQSTPLVIGIEQPIFQFNRLKWQNKIEPLQYEISKKEFIENMEGLSIQVTQSFFDAYLAKADFENAQFNVARNDSIYNISQGRYRLGTIAENDLLQSELALKNARAALVRSRIEYERSINNLKILLGYSTDVKFTLEVPDNLPEVYVNIQKAKRLALENNSEALSYRLSELQANRNLARVKGQGGLSATLQANYGLNNSAPDFADLYTDPESRQFFTIGFNLPIFNWGKQDAQVSAARNRQREVANNIQFQRRQFLQAVDYRVNQFLQLKDQVRLAAQADTIAQRRYFVAQQRYLIGKIDITNLFIAQEQKDAARLAYIRALREFWTGLHSLRQLTLYNFRENKPITYDL